MGIFRALALVCMIFGAFDVSMGLDFAMQESACGIVKEKFGNIHETYDGKERHILSRRKRVQNGKKVAQGEWPFLANVLRNQTAMQISPPAWMPIQNEEWEMVLTGKCRGKLWCNICGAVLLDENWVVTASHCVIDVDGFTVPAKEVRVRLGEHNLETESDVTHYDYEVEHIAPFVDGCYKKDMCMGRDYALLRLKKKVDTTEKYISPACLPKPFVRPKKNTTCYVAGWGMRNASDWHASPIPMHVRQTSIACKYLMKGETCTTSPFKSAAPCVGESGGPLICHDQKNDLWRLNGIVVSGDGFCALKESIFIDVSYWIWHMHTVSKNYDKKKEMQKMTDFVQVRAGLNN